MTFAFFFQALVCYSVNEDRCCVGFQLDFFIDFNSPSILTYIGHSKSEKLIFSYFIATTYSLFIVTIYYIIKEIKELSFS